MLVDCKECGNKISTQAVFCPSCGLPMKKGQNFHKKSRMRLPNGFGQITEIKNRNLRNPFRVMVTVGKNEFGKPICKLLEPKAYFSSYNEAYSALLEYNKDPYDLDNPTVSELYEMWRKEYEAIPRSKSTRKQLDGFWKYATGVKDMKVRELRSIHIKNILDRQSPSIQLQMKNYWNMMLDYAVEFQMTDKNYARSFKLSNDTKAKIYNNRKNHIAFTDEEMTILWANKNMPFVDMILIQCYSGWRPSELCELKISDVDLNEMTFTGGMKTKNGKNRIVPIHSTIQPLVLRQYENAKNIESEYLFNSELKRGKGMKYGYYLEAFNSTIKKLNLNPEHKPHDPRKHFVTMGKTSGMDEYAIKHIVGHAINDLTEKIYTERSVDWLRNEIEKIKGHVKNV